MTAVTYISIGPTQPCSKNDVLWAYFVHNFDHPFYGPCSSDLGHSVLGVCKFVRLFQSYNFACCTCIQMLHMLLLLCIHRVLLFPKIQQFRWDQRWPPPRPWSCESEWFHWGMMFCNTSCLTCTHVMLILWFNIWQWIITLEFVVEEILYRAFKHKTVFVCCNDSLQGLQ